MNYQLATIIQYGLIGGGIVGLIIDLSGFLLVPNYFDSQKNLLFIVIEPLMIVAGLAVRRRYKAPIKNR